MKPAIIVSLAAGLLIVMTTVASAQEMRPVRDDVGFCWDAHGMELLMQRLQSQEPAVHSDPTLIGGITPHDDFLYASRIYYPLYERLRTKEVIIFGVTHGTVRKEIGDPQNILMLDDYPAWRGPFGPVQISPLRSFIRSRLDTSMYKVNRKAHALEHSIEATVPFLQYYNRSIKITPIMVTAMPLERMTLIADSLASIITAYIRQNNLTLGSDIAIIISSDANHYGNDFNNTPFGDDSAAHAEGIALDRSIATSALAGSLDDAHVRLFAEGTWGPTLTAPGKSLWCGRFSIPMGLLVLSRVAAKNGGKAPQGELLRYSDTFTEGVLPLKGTEMGTTAPFSLKHWVGFCAVGYRLQ